MVTILWWIWAFWASVAALFLFRNVWLFNRFTALTDDEALSIKLTYGQMMLRFWVWDVRKFLPRSQG